MKKITLLLCLVLLLSLFTSCSKKTYNVEIKYEDGTTITITDIKEGTQIEEPSHTLPNEVKEIKYQHEDGSTFNFTDKITKNVTIYGIYVFNEYTINFYNYDKSLIATYTLPYGAEIQFPETPTREGGTGFTYVFKDWTSKETTVKKDTNFTARYTMVYDEMTVIGLDLDGDIYIEKKCDYDDYITAFKEPEFTKDPNKYYRFLGWFDKETDTLFDFDMEITKNYTLYPKYDIYELEDVTLENATISFLGDSISTFYSNTSQVNSLYGGENQFYYPIYSQTVKSVDKTWWYQTYTKLNLKLGVNNSWSGSCAYGSQASAGQSETRLKTLDDNGTPNIVVVFLGTNDNVNGFKVTDVEKAFTEIIEYITEKYVDFSNGTAKIPYIYLVTNGYSAYTGYNYTEERRIEYNNLIKSFPQKYNNVRVFDLAAHITQANYAQYLGDSLHYNADGMKLFADKLIEQLQNDFNQKSSARTKRNNTTIIYYKKEDNE